MKNHLTGFLNKCVLAFKYGIMTEELVIREIEATGRGDSDSRMTSCEVIMPLTLQSTMKALMYGPLRCLAGNS